jgi:phage terminase large subunit GpA-like protein
MPPRNSSFPAWIESTVRLPLGLAAVPGKITLAPYWREVANAMVDPAVEKITIVKSAQVGFSTLLSSLIGWHLTEKPAPILVVLPAELDARNAIVALEDIFHCSPALEHKLPTPSTAGRDSRNTLLYRRGTNGASLRLVGANAPRNLRAIVAKIVLIDEADALQDTEGDVITLAESRSLSFADKKTIIGGTPLSAETSRVAKSYGESDQCVWTVACPSCKTFSELSWQHFHWPEGQPERIRWRCPECGDDIAEKHKREMSRAGRWRVLRPEAGFGFRPWRPPYRKRAGRDWRRSTRRRRTTRSACARS